MFRLRTSGFSGAAGAVAAMQLFDTRFYSESSLAMKILIAAAVGGLVGWVLDRLGRPKTGE